MSQRKTAASNAQTRPTNARAAKTARIDARTSPAKKALYQQVAARKGQTFTEFVEASLDEAAARARREFEAMELTERESKAFADALLADAEPSATLVAAAKRYREQT